jgi:hypothetical protein
MVWRSSMGPLGIKFETYVTLMRKFQFLKEVQDHFWEK